MAQPLLILGASTRAAAFSSLAGGYAPRCGDCFGDIDLREVCPVQIARHYPRDLASIASAAGETPWMYTGALENHRQLVGRLERELPLFGNSAAVLARVRDPFQVADALEKAALPCLRLATEPAGLPRDGTWLRKSTTSSAGAGVEAWTNASADAPSSRRHYFQERRRGTSCAAVYVAAHRRAILLGASEQLLLPRRTGDDLAARYAGSLGPLPLTAARRCELERLGNVLASAFALVGLFGVDYIDDGRQAWPVELNPRYTASTEIIEREAGFSAVGWHVAACRDKALPAPPHDKVSAVADWHAKYTLYAPETVTVAPAFTEQARLAVASARGAAQPPPVADIPAAGTRIECGHPVMTVFAQAERREVALTDLNTTVRTWTALLLAP